MQIISTLGLSAAGSGSDLRSGRCRPRWGWLCHCTAVPLEGRHDPPLPVAAWAADSGCL